MGEPVRHFRFIRPIASGGFGTVYLCKEEHRDGFSRVVAVKLLNAQWTDSVEISSRIRDEARLLGMLRHRNIVDVYDLTSIDGRSAVVMEYLEAVDLRFLIQHCQSRGNRIPVRPAMEIVAAVAHALDAAYNRPPMKGEKPLRVIHRDIKPSNIMLDGNGGPKVLDFGVAQSDIASKEANTQELQFGSVEYMAPERLFFEPETPASDVYSLAATLFELLTFERLGKAQGRASKHDAHLANRLSFLRGRIEAPSEVAAGLEALLLRSLHFEHENRPDASTFCQDVKHLARQIQGDDLTIWSEIHVPDAVDAASERAINIDSVSNVVMIEDSVAREQDPATAEGLEIGPFPVAAPTHESARAAMLRRGALAELEASADLPAEPPAGLPGASAGGPLPDWTDGEGWNDRTLGDLTDGTEGAQFTGPQDVPEPGQVHAMTPEDSLPSNDFTTEQTQEVVPSVNNISEFETMDGLHAVRPSTPLALMFFGALIPLLGALVLGGLAVYQDWGGVRSVMMSVVEGSSVEAVSSSPGSGAAEAALVEDVEDEVGKDPLDAKVPQTSGSIRFVSKWPDTTKLRVRCKEEQAKGVADVTLERTAASRCSVTAIREDRSRLTGVVDVVTEGDWLCFEGGEEGCRQK